MNDLLARIDVALLALAVPPALFAMLTVSVSITVHLLKNV